MTTSRIQTDFQQVDGTGFDGTMFAVLGQPIVTSDGAIVGAQTWTFAVVDGQAYEPDGLTIASLVVTQAGSATPGGVPVTISLLGPSGTRVTLGAYVIPPEDGGPVLLSSLVPVSPDQTVIPLVPQQPISATVASTADLPAASSTYWGLLYSIFPGDGSAPEQLVRCLRVADGSYAWTPAS